MKLLVVENEHKVASSLKRGLEEAEHVVDTARTGNEGFHFASVQSYDLLILDCMLPDKGGRQVCSELHALGRQGQPVSARELSISDLQVEPASRRVRRGQSEIVLTTKEYLPLELLVRQCGQVVTRTEMIERVWDMRHAYDAGFRDDS